MNESSYDVYYEDDVFSMSEEQTEETIEDIVNTLSLDDLSTFCYLKMERSHESYAYKAIMRLSDHDEKAAKVKFCEYLVETGYLGELWREFELDEIFG